MMTQSVMTQAANLFGSPTVSVTSKGKQTGTGFDQIINSNLKSLKSSTGDSDAPAIKKTSAQKTDKANLGSDEKVGEANQADAAKNKAVTQKDNTSVTKTNEAQADNSKVTTKPEEENATEDETAVDDQVIAEVASLLQNVQQTVMDVLKLTSEEFEQLLADQGMNITDLLQPENLQQFILASKGSADITAVLTDENLAATMNDLLESIEDIKAEANLSLTVEQMKAILSKVNKTQDIPQEETVQLTADTGVTTSTQEKASEKPEAANAVNGSKEDLTKMNVTSDSREDSTTLTAKADATSESNTGSQENSNREENKDLQAADSFQTFIDNLVKTNKDTQVNFSGNMVQVTELREIASQIIERIKVSVTTDQTSMELQLNPENLGKVNLTVQSKNGVLTAQFVVQNEVSKEAIESQLNTLRETLNSQGLKVEAIEVTVSAYAFDQNSQEGSKNEAEGEKESSGKKITLEEALGMTDDITDDSSAQDITDTLGSLVDYTA